MSIKSGHSVGHLVDPPCLLEVKSVKISVVRAALFAADEAPGGAQHQSCGEEVHLLRSVREQDLHLQAMSGEWQEVHGGSQGLLLQRRLFSGSGQICLVRVRPRVSEMRSYLQVAFIFKKRIPNFQISKFRSRQQWYGNTDPEHLGVVHTEIAHVWPGVRPDQVVFTAGGFSQVSPGQ